MMRFSLRLTLLILLICPAMVSCGKKGDPFLPAPGGDSRVSGLEAKWSGEYVLLTGKIVGGRQSEAIRAYYAAYPLDQPPCEDCPIRYQGFESFGPEVMDGSGFSCKVTGIRPGNLYFFELRVIGPGQSQGPPSNRVRVEVR